MDELEISGKRYISTRRAAKEYKYHSDYIGQLIRGKNLLGRKVGRSWYVELDSLSSYFDKEGASIPKAELVAKAVAAEVPQAVEVATPVRVAAPIEKQYVATEVIEEREERVNFIKERNVEFEESARESIHIPVRVRRPSFETTSVQKAVPLTYVSDDEPYIPMTQRATRNALPMAMVMPRSQEEVEDMQEEVEEYAPYAYTAPKRKIGNAFAKIFSIAALGVVALAVAVGGSVLVSSHTIIEAGKAASVGYSLN